jgi:hypothetical protein
MAYQAKETPVNPIAAATVATISSVGTVGSVGQTGLETEEAEPEESSSELSADPEWAAELSRRKTTFEYLKRYHKRKKGKRQGMTKAEMNAEVKRALDEDAKRQASPFLVCERSAFRHSSAGVITCGCNRQLRPHDSPKCLWYSRKDLCPFLKQEP